MSSDMNPLSPKRPPLLELRSDPRFITFVACYGIFTVGRFYTSIASIASSTAISQPSMESANLRIL